MVLLQKALTVNTPSDDQRLVNALVLFSNPKDTGRIRLDKEHKALDAVLERWADSRLRIKRCHAASLDDLFREITSTSYEIIHFSGHGSAEGFYFESEEADGSELVDAPRLARLLEGALEGPRVTLYLSCFSSESIEQLSHVSPYVVTVTGPAGDMACIAFAESFYRAYCFSSVMRGSVSGAFREACRALTLRGQEDALSPVLLRRGVHAENDSLLPVMALGRDALIVDLSEVESQIVRLDVSREQFLSVLSRKLQLHSFVFEAPRDHCTIQLGTYFCVFSWENRDDPVTCHKIREINDDAEEEPVFVWAQLLSDHTHLCASRHRRDSQSAVAERSIGYMIERMQESTLRDLTNDRAQAVLRHVAPKVYKVSRGFFEANLRIAQDANDRGDSATAISASETALTALHDLVDELTAQLSHSV